MNEIPSRTARRLAGVAGLVAALSLVPGYLIGSPDVPATPEAAATYYEAAGAFILVNGFVPLLFTLGFIVFLAVIISLLRAAPRAPQWATNVALIGGIIALVMTSIGIAVEVVFPIAVSRFPEVASATEFPLLALMLAVWLYHLGHIGYALVMIGIAVVALATDVLPRWYAWVTVVLAVVALLHTLGSVVPSLGLIVGLASTFWIALTAGVLFVAGRGADTAAASAG